MAVTKAPFRVVEQKWPQVEAPAGVPRLARLMALAIRYEQLLRDDVVRSHAELPAWGHVTPARVSQIMGFLNLAANIQEAVLFLPPTESGDDLASEWDSKPAAGVTDWRTQRRIW